MTDNSTCEEFEVELAQIKKIADISRTTAENESLLRAIATPEVYKPLLLMIGFFGFQQFSGVVVIVVFAVQIATRAGVTTDPFLVAVMVGVARMITTFFMSTILEKWGRKLAGMVSAFGMTVCMFILALCAGWWPTLTAELPWTPVTCIILHIIFSTMGLLTLPFFMISEVFPQRVRGSASGLTVCFGLAISFVVIKIYPQMQSLLGTSNVFCFYGSMSLIAVAYIYFLVPETRGRTLLEIEEYFRTGRKLKSSSIRDAAVVEEEMQEMVSKNNNK